MEVMPPDSVITISSGEYSTAGATVLARVTADEYDPVTLDLLFDQAIDQAEAALLKAVACDNIGLDLRIWSREGRPSLNLSPKTLERLASLSSSFNFHPRVISDDGREIDQINAFGLLGLQRRPELIVMLRGRPDGNGKFVNLSRVESHWYSPAGLQARIAEALAAGVSNVPGEVNRWEVYVDIDLHSDRGIWPGFFLPAPLIKALASYNASLDFDPYIYPSV
ncbi:hypothetical protein [Stenotrophomonas maltophilia]|uniref:hypothetical protein n=1 Tax=Stenotrophomonas maltophilia TaxID=40324 RepID=UPI0034DB1CC1